MKSFENLLHELNSFGKYQKSLLLVICFGSLISPVAIYINIFISPNLDHYCIPADTQNLTGSESSECEVTINGSVQKCEKWEFDKTYYRSTQTEDWGLVCDYAIFRAYIQAIFFLGFFLGSICLGKISDSYGRRPSILIGLFLSLIGSFSANVGVIELLGVRVNYAIYTFSGFLIAFGTRGIEEAGYILALELTGPSKKAISGILIETFFAMGHIIVVVAAYYLRYWRDLSLFLFAFILPFSIYFKLIPESPRWLLSKNRKEEALDLLESIARANGTEVNQHLWKEVCAGEDKATTGQEKPETIFSLVGHTFFTVTFIATIILWISLNMTFYGIGLKTNDLGIDPYSSFFLASLLEVVACLATFLFINKLNRRTLFVVTLFVLGCCSMGIVFIEHVYISLTLALVAKFACTISFSVLRVYSNEIFPTTIRGSCIGACSTISRLGVIIAPIVNSYGDKHWKPLPFFIFGMISFLGILACFVLPETFDRSAAENLNEFNASFKARKVNVNVCDKNDTVKLNYWNPIVEK